MATFSFTAVGDMLIQRRISHETESFSEVRDFISRGEARYFNLETTLHYGEHFGGQFYGGSFLHADPRVLEDALAYGFNMTSFCNNHTLDFAYGGMLSTLEYLDKSPLVHAGVGRNLDEAAAPKYLQTCKGRIALIGTSTMNNDAALAGKQSRRTLGRPGLNGLRFDSWVTVPREELDILRHISKESRINAQYDIEAAEGYKEKTPDNIVKFKDVIFKQGDEISYRTVPYKNDMERIEKAIYEAQMQADYILVAIHAHEISGESKENPAEFLQIFARKCIDAGAHAVIGHGPHLLRPIEIYKRRPIFYSLGDFVLHNECLTAPAEDMYEKYGMTSDDTLRDLFCKRSSNYTHGLLSQSVMLESVIPYFEMEDGVLTNLELMPIDLGLGLKRWQIGDPRPASDPDAIIKRLAAMSAPFGTEIIKNEKGTYTVIC